MDATEKHASANLRSALWKLRRSGFSLVDANGRQLQLAPHVEVDLHEVVDLARRLIDGGDGDGELDDRALSGDLLPGWYEDWVLVERERLRQLRLHALEALAERLTGAQRYGKAVEAALAAVRGEPMRESAHRALIKVHLAEGNRGEAMRQYRLYKGLLQDELGVEPSAEMKALVGLDGAMTAR